MFDTLARRTVFSKLDNESMNLVIAFHGGTMFGVPAAYLTPRTIAFLRRYRYLWEHFSYRRCNIGAIFTIKFPVDTLQQKLAVLPLLRKQEGVSVVYGGESHGFFIGGFRSTGENTKVYLKYHLKSGMGGGRWKRVAELEDITFKSIFEV